MDRNLQGSSRDTTRAGTKKPKPPRVRREGPAGALALVFGCWRLVCLRVVWLLIACVFGCLLVAVFVGDSAGVCTLEVANNGQSCN